MCEACESLDFGVYDLDEPIYDEPEYDEMDDFDWLDETEEEYQQRMIEEAVADMEFAAGYFNDPTLALDYVPSMDNMVTSNQAFKAGTHNYEEVV